MSDVLLLFLAFCLLFSCNTLLTAGFTSVARRWKVFLDFPHKLSTHREVVVRGAGITFVLLTTLAWVLLQQQMKTDWGDALIFSALVIGILGLLDDLHGLPIRARVVVQIIAASYFLTAIPAPDFLIDSVGTLALLWYPCALFFLMATTNLYNFMDGVDGMVALHSLCLIFCWVCLSMVSGGPYFAQIFLCFLAAPLASFLILNWNPARVFMGDTGSTFLGFLFGALALVQVEGFPRSSNFIAFVLLMMPFLFDTTLTIIVRFLSGKRCSVRHRDFLFHKLVLAGVGQKNVAVVYSGMTLYNGIVLAFILAGGIGATLGLPLLVAPYLVLYSWTHLSTHRVVIYTPHLNLPKGESQ